MLPPWLLEKLNKKSEDFVQEYAYVEDTSLYETPKKDEENDQQKRGIIEIQM
jgi:hypothetical protein